MKLLHIFHMKLNVNEMNYFDQEIYKLFLSQVFIHEISFLGDFIKFHLRFDILVIVFFKNWWQIFTFLGIFQVIKFKLWFQRSSKLPCSSRWAKLRPPKFVLTQEVGPEVIGAECLAYGLITIESLSSLPTIKSMKEYWGYADDELVTIL